MEAAILLFNSILLISALKRSSCARSAFRTVQTTPKQSLLSRASSGLIDSGIITGIMMYPYFFPGALRITRPTDWTTSTCELREERNITASRDGTSTPSERQRTLVKIRQSFPAIETDLSQESFSWRVEAPIEPSMCCAETDTKTLRISDGNVS
ncbi:hypothetical protein SDC9_159061 [bioreactor metagenome]|uniref:Uncharacterized protein n=1 Tax=bioreactor metagenome TaxID=1076179 RepID=A0A645FHM8_9ZZZZ